MEKQGTHHKDIADVGNAGHEGRQRNGANLIGGEDARGVTAREYEERASFSIGRIEVDADGEQACEHVSTRFGNGDAVCRAVLATRLGNDGQDAILVNRYGPVCDGLLVKIGGIDGESIVLEKG